MLAGSHEHISERPCQLAILVRANERAVLRECARLVGLGWATWVYAPHDSRTDAGGGQLALELDNAGGSCGTRASS